MGYVTEYLPTFEVIKVRYDFLVMPYRARKERGTRDGPAIVKSPKRSCP